VGGGDRLKNGTDKISAIGRVQRELVDLPVAALPQQHLRGFSPAAEDFKVEGDSPDVNRWFAYRRNCRTRSIALAKTGGFIPRSEARIPTTTYRV
jgi:hypothetical protein